MQRLDFINEEMQKEHHAVPTFHDVDQAMKQYYYITDKQLDPLPPEPKLRITIHLRLISRIERLCLGWWQVFVDNRKLNN